jgi:hypothetical protein
MVIDGSQNPRQKIKKYAWLYGFNLHKALSEKRFRTDVQL